MTRVVAIAAALCIALASTGCGPAPASPASRSKAPQDAAATRARPDSRPSAGEVGAASRPESLPYSRDVPEGSRDPVVDGLKSIIREMMLTGLVKEEKAELAARIVAILGRAMLGEEAARAIEAELLATTLLSVQDEFRPKNAPQKKVLGTDDEQRIRIAAETLARDLYRKLQMIAPGGPHGRGQHIGALRASPTIKVPDGYELVTWKTMGGFEYVEGMELPEEVRRLDGKKVGVAGYMMTIEEVENIREFLLVEAFWSCCFGTPPNMNQVVMVKMTGEKGVEYTGSPVLLLGTFEVGEQIEDGFVTSVFRINATSLTATE